MAGCGANHSDFVTEASALAGEGRWQVLFDEAAQADGYVDCEYRRSYAGGVEDRSSPWRCLECEQNWKILTTLDEGRDDCYSQISDDVPEFVEWLGHGGGTFFRGAAENDVLYEHGTSEVDADQLQIHLETSYEIGSGTFTFVIDGDFQISTVEADPMHGLHAPEQYACGWPKADPPSYAGPYVLRQGEILPDGVFFDQCSEPVRLHDMKGQWMLLDISAADCPPCQQLAMAEHDLIATADSLGADLQVVTLLSASLVTNDSADLGLLDAWQEGLGTTGPILTDRAYGRTVVAEAVSSIGSTFAYPTMVLVDPDLEVRAIQTGFGQTTFDLLEEHL